jgi:hypothetical protein
MTPKWNRVQCPLFDLERCQGCDIIGSSTETKGAAFENRDLGGEITRRDRNDGAGHRLLEKQRSCRWIVRNVIPGNLSNER